MGRRIKPPLTSVSGVFNLLLFLTVVSGLMLSSAERGYSQTDCEIRVIKEVTTGEIIEFEFNQVLNGVESQIVVTSNAKPTDVFLSKGDNITITEVPQEGWKLEDIQCTASPNMSFAKLEDGFQAGCLVRGTDAGVVCTFLNRESPGNIPTLSEWGMITAAAGLGLIGVFFTVRRRRQAERV